MSENPGPDLRIVAIIYSEGGCPYLLYAGDERGAREVWTQRMREIEREALIVGSPVECECSDGFTTATSWENRFFAYGDDEYRLDTFHITGDTAERMIDEAVARGWAGR